MTTPQRPRHEKEFVLEDAIIAMHFVIREEIWPVFWRWAIDNNMLQHEECQDKDKCDMSKDMQHNMICSIQSLGYMLHVLRQIVSEHQRKMN